MVKDQNSSQDVPPCHKTIRTQIQHCNGIQHGLLSAFNFNDFCNQKASFTAWNCKLFIPSLNCIFSLKQNLAEIDPYYILPTLTIGMYYWNFERFITPENKDTLMSKIRIACQYFLILWYPFLCCWPSGIVIYMCTNALMSILQSNLMKKPWFLNKIAPEVV